MGRLADCAREKCADARQSARPRQNHEYQVDPNIHALTPLEVYAGRWGIWVNVL